MVNHSRKQKQHISCLHYSVAEVLLLLLYWLYVDLIYPMITYLLTTKCFFFYPSPCPDHRTDKQNVLIGNRRNRHDARASINTAVSCSMLSSSYYPVPLLRNSLIQTFVRGAIVRNSACHLSCSMPYMHACVCVSVCVYEITHNRAIRRCHPSHSMPLALILPREDRWYLLRKPLIRRHKGEYVSVFIKLHIITAQSNASS